MNTTIAAISTAVSAFGNRNHPNQRPGSHGRYIPHLPFQGREKEN